MTQLNWHSKWRLELAKTISDHLQRFTGIRAITAGGSVARGYADPYSDLEMPLFWDEQPAGSVREAIAAMLRADTIHFSTRPAGEDNFLINGFQVDLWHIAISEAEAIFDKVLKQYDPDLKYSNFIDTIQICIPLYGEAVMNRLKQRIQACPDELVLRSIKEYISQFRAKHLELHLIRDNPTLLYGTISELHKLIFLILLALNGNYFPSFKWMYHSLKTLRLKPINLEQRFRHTFRCPPSEAIDHTRQIIDETLTLVNDRFPQIDTDSIRRENSFSRTAHNQPVNLIKTWG